MVKNCKERDKKRNAGRQSPLEKTKNRSTSPPPSALLFACFLRIRGLRVMALNIYLLNHLYHYVIAKI
jgi:hypothetical protein